MTVLPLIRQDRHARSSMSTANLTRSTSALDVSLPNTNIGPPSGDSGQSGRIALAAAQGGQTQIAGRSALTARTRAYTVLCRRRGSERVLLARGRRKLVEPLPSAFSYMRLHAAVGFGVGVRRRRGRGRIPTARIAMEALVRRAQAKQRVGQRGGSET